MSDPRQVLRHLDLKHLRQLIEVAERGSIRAAASALGITQPALSRSIRGMEEAVEARLIERGPRGTELTAVGETLLRFARIIDANLALAERELQELKAENSQREHVRFGMSWLAESIVAGPLVEALLATSPQLRLTASVGDYETLAPKLAAGKIDFFLGPPPLQTPAVGVSTELVTEFRAVLLMRASHPLAHVADIAVSELANQDWILPTVGTLPRITYDNFFLRHGIQPPTPVLEVQPLSPVIRALIVKRDLVTILPAVVAERDVREGHIVARPLPEPIVFPMHVTRRQLGFPSLASERVVAAVRRLCADHASLVTD